MRFRHVQFCLTNCEIEQFWGANDILTATLVGVMVVVWCLLQFGRVLYVAWRLSRRGDSSIVLMFVSFFG